MLPSLMPSAAMCECASMMPGMTYCPPASMILRAGRNQHLFAHFGDLAVAHQHGPFEGALGDREHGGVLYHHRRARRARPDGCQTMRNQREPLHFAASVFSGSRLGRGLVLRAVDEDVLHLCLLAEHLAVRDDEVGDLALLDAAQPVRHAVDFGRAERESAHERRACASPASSARFMARVRSPAGCPRCRARSGTPALASAAGVDGACSRISSVRKVVRLRPGSASRVALGPFQAHQQRHAGFAQHRSGGVGFRRRHRARWAASARREPRHAVHSTARLAGSRMRGDSSTPSSARS